MLSPNDILKINGEITDRPISKEASVLLSRGAQRYKKESPKYLGHGPSKDEAIKSIKGVLSKLEKAGGEITAKEVASVCEHLPYPLNLWFC